MWKCKDIPKIFCGGSMAKKLDKNNICAVVVTYNPDKILLDNVSSLINQVGGCLVIDNCSTKQKSLDLLEDVIAHFPTVEYKKMKKNYGIARALNVGLQYCVKEKYGIIITIDQDTVLEKDAVGKLLYAMVKYGASSVGINWDGRSRRDKKVTYLITSGNMIKVDALLDIGGYDDNLFIDSVDFDISLRLVDAGYKLVKVYNALAIHKIGEYAGERKLFGLRFQYRTHTAERFYYMYKNHRYVIKKYWKKHILFCIKKEIMSYMEILRVILFDDYRTEKIKMIRKGICDSCIQQKHSG